LLLLLLLLSQNRVMATTGALRYNNTIGLPQFVASSVDGDHEMVCLRLILTQ